MYYLCVSVINHEKTLPASFISVNMSLICDTRGTVPFVTVRLLIVIDPDEVARRGEGVPGDVEPAVASEELVGELPGFEEID